LEELTASKKGFPLMKQEKQLSSQDVLPVIEEADLDKVMGGTGPSTPLLGGAPHLSSDNSTDKGSYFPPDVYQTKIEQAKAVIPNAPTGTNIVFQNDKEFTATTPPNQHAPHGITTWHKLP
jgi:hypothetical protein